MILETNDIGGMKMINSTNKSSLNMQKSPAEKLVRRIDREFKKCTYIGDIQIDDEEYQTVILFLKHGYKKILSSPQHETINPLFAVGLVQIGIRYYDGRFWPHVQKELKLEKLPMNHQGWIGKSFYKTLIRFGKFHVAENEFMNNILLHCFITKHYANDLFDFLFAYYQIDLERDLSRNSAEMRKYLMQTMSKGEASARAYKIKKHTADAVSANEQGCKIRVGRILRFMDNALFNDLYPENSQNRIAQLFCEWAKSSGRFEYARRATAGLTRKGEKRFSTPFIHFDTKREKFYLVLPQQYIHLNAEDDIPQMYWRIRIENFENILEVSSDSCVTGCKTEKIDCFEVPADRLLQEIEIELLKDSGGRVKRFLLKSASIRFFDNDWDMIDSVTYTKYLPEGQAYAFTDPDGVLQTDSDAIDGFEKSLGYGLYTLTLQKGDVLRLPDGKAKSVGKPLEEGLLQQKLVHGAYVMRDEKISIYSTTPSVYFRMKPNQENGTLIIINGERFRFDAEKCVRFDLDEKTDEKGYILKLSEYIVQDGIYEVIINVPESKKERSYCFARINYFGFQYNEMPYIFKQKGLITFDKNIDVQISGCADKLNENCFEFQIRADLDYLPFVVNTQRGALDVRVYLPVFKWRFDGGTWRIDKPDEIWHTEFPSRIEIKAPDDSITFSMTPILLDSDDLDSENESFSVSFPKSKEQHLFVCDTRKIISWFGKEEAKRILYVTTDTMQFSFATVVTRCVVNNVEIIEDRATGELIFKSNISGFSNCVADIAFCGEVLAEKVPITTAGIRLRVPFRTGDYTIIYYEWDEDEDDFGIPDYREFDVKNVPYRNRFDLTGKTISITGIAKFKNDTSIFATHYSLQKTLYITNIKNDDQNPELNIGELNLQGKACLVKIKILNDVQTKANITFFSEEDEDYFDFLYNRAYKIIATDEIGCSREWEVLDSEDFYYTINLN